MVNLFAIALLYVGDTVLLLHRHNTDFGNGLFGLPGGKVEQGETARQAISREIEEKLDLRVKRSELFSQLKNNVSNIIVGDKSGWELKYVSRGMLLNHLHILRELGKITSKTMDHVETEYGTSMRPGNIDELCKKYYPEQKND